MTGAEVLDFYCRLFRMDKPTRKTEGRRAAGQVGLGQDGHRALRQYSKGMLQRVGIAQALINDPDLLFFDEPTSGLDPIAHKDIQELIVSLRKQGKTVFLSSHQLSDVEMVCDRVAIINRGKLVKIGTLDELLHAGRTVVTLSKPGEELVEKLKPLAERVSADGEQVRVYVETEENVHKVLDTGPGQGDAGIGCAAEADARRPLRGDSEGGAEVIIWSIAKTTIGDALSKKVLQIFLVVAIGLIVISLSFSQTLSFSTSEGASTDS